MDVETSIEFKCPRSVVAAFVSNPDNATLWYTYSWRDAESGGTRMSLRNAREPNGFGKMSAPMMAAAMRTANQADPARLKTILENKS